jgi:uncharacterized membrane protein YozB (DUF420 family)|tara:strand:+ start:140 stop:556 length:417 start_codon:yes stop_codon:yes gene_type:complete
MLDVTTLPAVNATLNSLAAVLLATGYVLVRRGRVRQHRLCMLAAFTTSVLFLVSYLVYHAQVGSQPFTGLGPVRIVYFTVLISHITLAAIIVPLALVTLRRGLRRNDARHVAIARWTLPIWLYVSATGVVVYWMLYQM